MIAFNMAVAVTGFLSAIYCAIRQGDSEDSWFPFWLGVTGMQVLFGVWGLTH